MDTELLYAAAFIALIAMAVAFAVLAVRRDGRDVGNLLKQLIIWVGISTLLPLTAWSGATMLHPRTTLDDLTAQRSRVQQDAGDTKDDTARKNFRDRQDELTKQIDEETRLFNRSKFMIGFPIGLAALVVGLFLRPIAVGTGLCFGGLCTLGEGCYSYWDHMGDAMRFFSLLIVLAVLVAVGLAKYGRRPEEPRPI